MNTRNITISAKVTAIQKAEFSKIALKHNLSLSEWVAILLEIHKDSYDKIGDPTLREIKLEYLNCKKDQRIKQLEAKLESADHRVQVEMERSENAVLRRDAEILKQKELLNENLRLKTELKKNKDLAIIDLGEVTNKDFNKQIDLIVPIAFFSTLTWLAFGKNHR